MRLAISTVLVGFLVACATGETPNDGPDDLPDETAGSSGSFNNTSGSAQGGSAQGGSSSTGGTGGSSAGSFGSGGTPSNGGTFNSAGMSFSGSTFGTAGAAGGAAPVGGTGGTGGTASTGGSAAGAGGGGKAGAGSGGTGGAPPAGCPAKTAWTATASVHAMDCTDATSPYCGPPERAIDGITTNRYTTGTARLGTEWLQVDFGKVVTVSKVTLTTAAGSTDNTLAYEVRLSSDANIASTAAIVSGTGMQGVTTITLPAGKTGRYLRVNQTMAANGWWSVAEMNVDCQ